jgi:hypothetical protein
VKSSNYTMKVLRPWGGISQNKEDGYAEGVVFTPNGIVDVYSQDGDPHTVLRVVIDGRLHQRNIHKAYTKRGLVTLATRYAAELKEQDK